MSNNQNDGGKVGCIVLIIIIAVIYNLFTSAKETLSEWWDDFTGNNTSVSETKKD